jgi:hypothetical protein
MNASEFSFTTDIAAALALSMIGFLHPSIIVKEWKPTDGSEYDQMTTLIEITRSREIEFTGSTVDNYWTYVDGMMSMSGRHRWFKF